MITEEEYSLAVFIVKFPLYTFEYVPADKILLVPVPVLTTPFPKLILPEPT
jgi:hypothetical protein